MPILCKCLLGLSVLVLCGRLTYFPFHPHSLKRYIPDCWNNNDSVPAISNSDIIYWSRAYRLGYDDFQGDPSKTRDAPFDTSAICDTYITYRLKAIDNKLNIHAFAVFSRKVSWMREKNVFVLHHEQGHFDISEIYAMQFEKAVNQLDILKADDFVTRLQFVYHSIGLSCKAEQDKYDMWTQNTPGREYYDKWIPEQLDSFGL